MAPPEHWNGTTIHVPPELLDPTGIEDMAPVILAFIEGLADEPSDADGETQ